MANSVSTNIPLKFTKNDFSLEDTPDLLINVWTYNYYKPHCNACKIYCNWRVEILEERWKEEWGDFEKVIEKFKKNDAEFININNYSSLTK